MREYACSWSSREQNTRAALPVMSRKTRGWPFNYPARHCDGLRKAQLSDICTKQVHTRAHTHAHTKKHALILKENAKEWSFEVKVTKSFLPSIRRGKEWCELTNNMSNLKNQRGPGGGRTGWGEAGRGVVGFLAWSSLWWSASLLKGWGQLARETRSD